MELSLRPGLSAPPAACSTSSGATAAAGVATALRSNLASSASNRISTSAASRAASVASSTMSLVARVSRRSGCHGGESPCVRSSRTSLILTKLPTALLYIDRPWNLKC